MSSQYFQEFAALDAALESISHQYEDAAPAPPPQDASDLDDLLHAEAPPPPVPEFEEDWDAPAELARFSDAQRRAASVARGESFATVRSLNIDEERALYGGATVRPSATVAPVAPVVHKKAPVAVEAPWGEQSLRFSATNARPATEETMRATSAKAREGGGGGAERMLPLHEEFDLANPPDEEKKPLVLPTIGPNDPPLLLRVACMDGRVENIEATPGWTVEQLLVMMGAKLTMWQVGFFALAEGDPNSQAPERWLDPRKTIEQEGLSAASRLVFKIKYFKYPKKLRDPQAVYYFYAQTRALILNGTMEVTEAMSFKLAALQLAIQQQTYRPQDLRRGFLGHEMTRWIPKGHLDEIASRGLSEWYVERRIYGAYDLVKDMSAADGVMAYLKTVKDLPLYGSTVFNVTLNGQPRVLAVAEDGILLSADSAQKLQFFTPKGMIVNRPKYDFTPYEDITKISVDKGTVTIVILSDTDAANHVLQLAPAAAASLVELFCGYRRMLEAYVSLSKSFVYPVVPRIPHPALFGKPIKRKKLMYAHSRTEVFKSHYIKMCKERNMPVAERLLYVLDVAVDTGVPCRELDWTRWGWGKAEFNLVFDAMTAAKTHQFSDDEEFSENMKLDLINFTGNNVKEKGFFADLERHFEAISKFPFEVGGVCFRGCALDDKALDALRPALVKLKSMTRADFSKNQLHEEGVKSLVLALRDANPSFTELTINSSSLHEPKIMKLVAAMLDKNSCLSKLDLSSCGITDIGVLFLLKGLMNHTRIRSLDMSGNKLGSSKASADLFFWAQRTVSLEDFRMARTEMGPKSAKAVAALLEDPGRAGLKALDIGGNAYGAKGAVVILQALSKNATLQEVRLGGLDINEKNVEGLLRFIKKAGKTLTLVDLRASPLGKRGLNVVLEELGDSCPKLKVLDLARSTFLGKANGAALVDFVRKTASLEKLVFFRHTV